MALVNLLLNCACLLLWLNWASRASGPRRGGIALVSTLRRAEPAARDRWRSPIILFLILLLRAVVYWELGPSALWVPKLSLGAIVLHFRNDVFLRMLVFSMLSFAVALAGFYFCLLLITAVSSRKSAADPWQNILRAMLGVLDRLPAGIKVALPFFVGALFWLATSPLLSQLGVQPPVKTFRHLVEESALVGVAAFLPWKYAIAAILGLYFVTSYVYLGTAPLWQFVAAASRDLLRPIAPLPLRFGRVDLAPIFALVAVFAAAEAIEYLLPILYSRLPV